MPILTGREANFRTAQPEVGAAKRIRRLDELTVSLSQNPHSRRQTPSTDSHIAPRTPVANMGPPPFPVDPELNWNNTSQASVHTPDLDGLLLPNNGFEPQLYERPPLPGSSGGTVIPPENFNLPPFQPRETDPMRRWNDDPAAPWTSERVGGNWGQYAHPYVRYSTEHTTPGSGFNNYRGSPRSEVSAGDNGRARIDSGYGTRSMGSSEQNMDRLDQSQGCPSVAMDFSGLHVNGDSINCGPDDPYSSLDGTSDTSSRPRPSSSFLCPYDNCSHVSKNNSEHK